MIIVGRATTTSNTFVVVAGRLGAVMPSPSLGFANMAVFGSSQMQLCAPTVIVSLQT
jgi:hypothetical protein